MPSRRRTYFLVPLFIALCALAAGLLGGGDVAAATGPDDSVSQSLKSFTRVYDVVEQNFADQVKPDTAIYDGAIPGMLHTLDPHSNFFDPKEYAKLREDQSGHYYGVGMVVANRGNKTIVQYPFKGAPAFKAGLRPGDMILQVNDTKTDGLNTTQIADLLKGPRGTHVQVMVGRDGVAKPIAVDIVRDEIPRSSVSVAMLIKPGIAYARIDAFNEDTGKELEDALKKMDEKNLQGLVLDLRGNPGGLLNEGVEVAGHFLKHGELVVSHHGRLPSSNKNYTARSDGSGVNYPIVVLVNRSTASAAEIVSGALQDHDRGWILGETTFGKGLVQTVFPLSDNTGLALTTAHYYTPSGRLIQRDYSNISFLDYYYHTNLNQKNTADVKMTDSGRTVYGGGGITPDEHITCGLSTVSSPSYCTDTDKPDKLQAQIVGRGEFFNFSASYFGPRTNTTLPKGWTPTEAVINQFHDLLLKDKVDFTEAEFTKDHDWIRQQLKREMYITAFSFADSQRVAVNEDPEVATAIEAMPKARALLETAKKLVVERLSSHEPQR
jgi:carboxyl-terminal processing protease